MSGRLHGSAALDGGPLEAGWQLDVAQVASVQEELSQRLDAHGKQPAQPPRQPSTDTQRAELRDALRADSAASTAAAPPRASTLQVRTSHTQHHPHIGPLVLVFVRCGFVWWRGALICCSECCRALHLRRKSCQLSWMSRGRRRSASRCPSRPSPPSSAPPPPSCPPQTAPPLRAWSGYQP